MAFKSLISSAGLRIWTVLDRPGAFLNQSGAWELYTVESQQPHWIQGWTNHYRTTAQTPATQILQVKASYRLGRSMTAGCPRRDQNGTHSRHTVLHIEYSTVYRYRHQYDLTRKQLPICLLIRFHLGPKRMRILIVVLWIQIQSDPKLPIWRIRIQNQNLWIQIRDSNPD